jgi:hypothetical protein
MTERVRDRAATRARDHDGDEAARGGAGDTGARALVAVGLMLVLGLYAGLTLPYLAPRGTIENLDFWTHIGVGLEARVSDPTTMVDGFYPIGYPLLLRAAIGSGLDVLRFGQTLSWLGGLLMLLAAYGLVVRATGSAALAPVAPLLLLANRHFLVASTREGNDALAAGLQLGALWCVWSAGGDRTGRRWALLAGAVLGVAYLVRYTALAGLPLLVLFVAWRAWPPARAALVSAAILLAGFLVAASPQVVPSLLATGQPFANFQAKNVWFAMYGEGDFVEGWRGAPDDISIAEVVAPDPVRFARHWGATLLLGLRPPGLWPMLVYLAALAGSVVLALDRRLAAERRALLLLAWLLPLAATAFAWLDPRFLLQPLAVQAVIVGYLADRVTRSLPAPRPASAAITLFVLVLAVQPLAVARDVLAWRREPVRQEVERVHRLLGVAGLDDPSAVATNHPSLHATDVPARTRYAKLYDFAPEDADLSEILAVAGSQGWCTVVFAPTSGFGAYGDARQAAREPGSGLTPLLLEPDAEVFALDSCLGRRMAAADLGDGRPPGAGARARFSNGMALGGSVVHTTSRGASACLEWEVDRAVTRSYKVSVRALDAGGAIVTQTDAVPRLWTAPTESWAPGTPVLDCHVLLLDDGAATAAASVGLVVYDSETLEPVAVASGGDGASETSVTLGVWR